MMMLLSILCASAVVLTVLAAILSTIDRAEDEVPELKISARPSKFFADDTLRDRAQDDLAIEVMLAQIERHVRLEQTAAQNFLDLPTTENLHSGTTSPRIN